MEPGERFEERCEAGSGEDAGECGFEGWDVVWGDGVAKFLL